MNIELLVSDPYKEKRREKVILKDIGATTKKIQNVVDCNDVIGINVKKYVASTSLLLCKGVSNTKRIFVRNDSVWVLCPDQVEHEQVIVIVFKKKDPSKNMIFLRKLEEIEPNLDLKEDTEEFFVTSMKGETKLGETVCYCITPIRGFDIWVDGALSRKTLLEEIPRNKLVTGCDGEQMDFDRDRKTDRVDAVEWKYEIYSNSDSDVLKY